MAMAKFCSAMRRAARATASVSSTGARRSPWNTASAAVCEMSAALEGEREACAAASAGASLRPSPTISTLRPSPSSASRRAILAAGSGAGDPAVDAGVSGGGLDHGRPVAGQQLGVEARLAQAARRRSTASGRSRSSKVERDRAARRRPDTRPSPCLRGRLGAAPGGRAESFGPVRADRAPGRSPAPRGRRPTGCDGQAAASAARTTARA